MYWYTEPIPSLHIHVVYTTIHYVHTCHSFVKDLNLVLSYEHVLSITCIGACLFTLWGMAVCLLLLILAFVCHIHFTPRCMFPKRKLSSFHFIYIFLSLEKTLLKIGKLCFQALHNSNATKQQKYIQSIYKWIIHSYSSTIYIKRFFWILDLHIAIFI